MLVPGGEGPEGRGDNNWGANIKKNKYGSKQNRAVSAKIFSHYVLILYHVNTSAVKNKNQNAFINNGVVCIKTQVIYAYSNRYGGLILVS